VTITQPIAKTVPLLDGVSNPGNANYTSRYVELTNCQRLSLTTVVSVTVNDFAGTIGLGGTNDEPLVSTFPLVTTGTVITSALPAGWTFSTATGLLTAATPAIGTYEFTIDYSRFPKWARALYTYSAGTGTITARVILAAWS
jgi:hypothetical protein